MGRLGDVVLSLLSEFEPGVFKTILLVMILLSVVLVALFVKLVPIAASAVGWRERLSLMTTNDRTSIAAKATRIVYGGEDFLEHLIEWFRR